MDLSRLFERQSERELLRDMLQRPLAERTGAVVVVKGEAGIGKSALLDQLAEDARVAGVRVLRTHGTELESDLAFGAVRRLLAPLLRNTRLQEWLGGPAALARGALGLAGSAPAVGDASHGLFWLLANVAEDDPLLLVVDDWHWLDEESDRFLGYLARRIDEVPVLLACATRRTEADFPTADLDDIAVVVEPGPLTEAGVTALLEETVGDLAAEYAADCLAATGGNPFLVTEMAQSIAAAQTSGDPFAAASVSGRPAVARSAMSRAVAISPAALAVVRALAVFPDGAFPADLAAVTGLAPAEMSEAAIALVSAGILADTPRLVFRHPLVRAAVDETLGAHERSRLHQLAATHLTARGAPVEEVAAHLLASQPLGNAAHVRVLEAAADRAATSGAARGAIRYLSRAMAEPPPPEDRWRIAFDCGCLQARSGSPDAESTLTSALVLATTNEQKVDSSIQLATVRYADLRSDGAVTLLLPWHDHPELDRERQLLVDGVLAAAAWESEEYGEVYLKVADSIPKDLPGDTPGERLALIQVVGRMFDRCEPHEQVLDVLRHAVGDRMPPLVVIGPDLGDPLAFVIGCGALDEAEALCAEREDEARRAGHGAQYASIQVARARIARLRGRFRDSEAITQLAMELPELRPFDRSMLLNELALVCVERGQLDHAESLLAEASAAGGLAYLSGQTKARIDLARGDREAALAFFERAHKQVRERGTANPIETIWTLHYVVALDGAGREREAADVMAPFVAAAEAFGAPRALGVALRTRGTLAADGTADLERASQILTEAGYAYEAALAEAELGATLRRTGQRREARRHLEMALDYAQREQVEPLAKRMRDELAASGARPRREALTGVDSLTASERRVAELAATGMTNREIAQHLFLTGKTIEMHLGRTFRKLSISSRRELSGALAGSAEPSTP